MLYAEDVIIKPIITEKNNMEMTNGKYTFQTKIDATKIDIKNADTLTLKEQDSISAYDIDSLNFNWTNGVTCGELFKDLTPYEREIIILSFIKNKKCIW